MTKSRMLAILCTVLLIAPVSTSFAWATLNEPAQSTSSQGQGQELLSADQLDSLVAPLALYPDPILSQVLVASTYPLEIVQASRWLNQNSSLSGKALADGAAQQPWDASVQALVMLPDLLHRLSKDIRWTSDVGDAFLAQEQDVMDAVQRMRARAYDRKKLVTTKEQVVNVKEEQSRQVISIEPAVPDTLYVPYYEPQVVYGDWPYADYPAYPYYWGYPGYIAAGVIATGLAFGGAYALGRWASGGYWGRGGYWGGSRINWAGGGINVNRGARVEHWQHDVRHRQGARYNNANLQQRFGSANGRAGAGIAAGAAGAAGAVAAQRLGTGANRANVADRAQRVDRGRANRQAGAGRTAGNRQVRNRGTAARNARSGGRAAQCGGSARQLLLD